MRAKQFVVESVTFSPAKILDREGGQKVWSSEMFGQNKMVPCRFCAGTGVEGYQKTTGKDRFYFTNPKEIEQRLAEMDPLLKKLTDHKEKLVRERNTLNDVMNNWLDSIKGSKDLGLPSREKASFAKRAAAYLAKREFGEEYAVSVERMSEKINQFDEQIAKVDQTIKNRMARIPKRKELIQKLQKVPCGYCHGKGEHEDWVSDAPELNVSNANAYEIQEMLGIKNPDFAGGLTPQQLPDAMRRLLQLKNKEKELASYTKQPEFKKGEMRKYKDDQGNTRIGRGASMYDFGRSTEQVNRYVDTLIKMIQFAQKHGAGISWG